MILGIVYAFLSAFIAKTFRIIGLVVATAESAFLFSTPYTVMIFGISLSMALGKPLTMKEKLNAPMISSEYGALFDIVGWLLAIGGLITLSMR